MKKPLILIGGGGHCRSCIDVIEQEGKYAILGILDQKAGEIENVLGYPVIGNDERIRELVQQEYYFLVAIGQIESATPRKNAFSLLMQLNAFLPVIVSPNAVVSPHARIGQGTIVMHGVHINSGAVIGNNVILNTNCIVEHDVLVGDHVHVSTGSILNGAVKVADECFVGSNAVVIHGKQLTGKTVIGAGSVVIDNIDTAGSYVGNPAKRISK